MVNQNSSKSVSKKSYACIITTTFLAKYLSHTLSIPLYLTYLSTMAHTSQAVPHQIETQVSNKLTHLGSVFKPVVPQRTSAKVQQEHEAKAKAKAESEMTEHYLHH